MMKSICFITSGYPTKDDPEYAFIRTTVAAIADLGLKCKVVAPQNINAIMLGKKKRHKTKWLDKTDSGNVIEIYQPFFFSFSRLSLNNVSLSTLSRIQSVRKCTKKHNIKPDILYGHFWDNALIAAAISNGECPVIAVTGESKIRLTQLLPRKMIQKYLVHINGVISVSTKNINESKNLGLITEKMKTVVLPNAVDERIFFKKEKKAIRRKLKFRDSDVIAVFVGSFCDRKGPLRVVKAASKVNDLKLVFIGKGTQEPQSESIVFKGEVPHDEIADYLNAADFFILPTKAEGCCNAIIEALACGLPVISSNLDFNMDILDESCAILIDPESIEEISSAMHALTNKEYRLELSKGAIEKASSLSIHNRARSIVAFLDEF